MCSSYPLALYRYLWNHHHRQDDQLFKNLDLFKRKLYTFSFCWFYLSKSDWNKYINIKIKTFIQVPPKVILYVLSDSLYHTSGNPSLRNIYFVFGPQVVNLKSKVVGYFPTPAFLLFIKGTQIWKTEKVDFFFDSESTTRKIGIFVCLQDENNAWHPVHIQ